MFDSISARARRIAAAAAVTLALSAAPLAASDQIYFPATDNTINVIVNLINQENVRIDISAWYLTEHAISIAVANRFAAGVPVRLIGDRGSIFEIDPNTRTEFYYLANAGVPIRLRYNPTWYPEIDHWKAAIFKGQGIAEFGSANWTTFELAPFSSTNYDDETVMVTSDPVLVGAFLTKFDRIWNDTTVEPQSVYGNPPYLKNWYDACALESACSDFTTQYPNPAPMVINTARLEPDNALPPDLIWGQGPDFNNRLITEIGNENSSIAFVIYRLTVENITQALLNKAAAGVPIKLLIEPNEYLNKKWPEFWLTHAYIDKLWAAGIPIKQRIHTGLTHMKTLVTSTYATNASSNYAAGWQRDHDYFISPATKPAIYTAIANRVQSMWNDTSAFATFQPQPPDAPTLSSPVSGTTGAATNTALVWNIAAFATSYDVYLGTSPSTLTRVANVPAVLTPSPPSTYSWTPPTPLSGGTTYYWQIVSRTFATPVNPAMVASSSVWSFSTGGTVAAPPAPTNPVPSNGATNVAVPVTLQWTGGPAGTTYNVNFGTTPTPPQVASGLTSTSYSPGALSSGTTYYWQITSVNAGGSTAGSVWSFTTGTSTAPPNIVVYAGDVSASGVHGAFSLVSDGTAAGGSKLASATTAAAHTSSALASPTDYVDVTFSANAGVSYTLWLRVQAANNSKYSDSLWVQFSDAVAGGSPVYQLNTTAGLLVNLATDGTASSLSGWGWVDGAYWMVQPATVSFSTSGTHTLRIQVREPGVQFDQVVLSPATYYNASASCPTACAGAPGGFNNDTTIVPKPSTTPPPPQPPTAPSAPSPANGATGVSTSATLAWSASGATSYNVLFGTTNPPPQVATGISSASYTPSGIAAGTTYYWQIVAVNSTGSTTGPIWSFTTAAAPPPSPSNIVVYASDVPAANLHGGWSSTTDATAASGVKLASAPGGTAHTSAPLASPADYVDVTFNANAGVSYTLWLRVQAANNSKYSDSLWVQFSDAVVGGAATYPLSSTSGLLVNLATDSTGSSDSGWGWVNGAYWLTQAATVSFASSGSHTLRIQVREPGVQVDQIVLSPSTYYNASASCPLTCGGAPGPVSNDATVVPK